MNWLHRYVEAVKRYLPRAKRDDVGEELNSILEEKLEEAEEAKGQPLDEAEVLGFLKNFGHPLLVASRYGRQRALVSEALLPIYKQVLKYLLLGFFTLLVESALISVSSVLEWWPSDLSGRIQVVGLWCILLVTIAFHFVDSVPGKLNLFARWNPERLPAIYGTKPISLFESIVSLVAGLVIFSILSSISNEYSWEVLTGQSTQPWVTVVLWLKIRVVLGMGLHADALFRPYWSPPRLLVAAFKDLLLSLIAFWALATLDTWVGIQVFFGVLALAGLSAAVGDISKLSRIGRPSAAQRPNWLARHVEDQVKRSLPKRFPESVGEQVRSRLERKLNGPDGASS